MDVNGDAWQTFDTIVELPAGTQYIEFRIEAGDVDLDNFTITKL